MSEIQKAILEALAQPRKRQEIVDRTGLREATVKNSLESLRERGLVHIYGWQGTVAIYAKGKGDCARVIKDVTDDEVEGWFRQPVNVVVRRDPLVAALFGHSRA